jgi:hypothetical protein
MTLGSFQKWLSAFLRNVLPPSSGYDRNFYLKIEAACPFETLVTNFKATN